MWICGWLGWRRSLKHLHKRKGEDKNKINLLHPTLAMQIDSSLGGGRDVRGNPEAKLCVDKGACEEVGEELITLNKLLRLEVEQVGPEHL